MVKYLFCRSIMYVYSMNDIKYIFICYLENNGIIYFIDYYIKIILYTHNIIMERRNEKNNHKTAIKLLNK